MMADEARDLTKRWEIWGFRTYGEAAGASCYFQLVTCPRVSPRERIHSPAMYGWQVRP